MQCAKQSMWMKEKLIFMQFSCNLDGNPEIISPMIWKVGTRSFLWDVQLGNNVFSIKITNNTIFIQIIRVSIIKKTFISHQIFVVISELICSVIFFEPFIFLANTKTKQFSWIPFSHSPLIDKKNKTFHTDGFLPKTRACLLN